MNRCPECDKLILLQDEMQQHCLTEHGHHFNFLKEFNAVIKEIDKREPTKNNCIKCSNAKRERGSQYCESCKCRRCERQAPYIKEQLCRKHYANWKYNSDSIWHERQIEQSRKYAAEHPAYQKEHYQKNKEKINEGIRKRKRRLRLLPKNVAHLRERERQRYVRNNL